LSYFLLLFSSSSFVFILLVSPAAQQHATAQPSSANKELISGQTTVSQCRAVPTSAVASGEDENLWNDRFVWSLY
jgi:hypothetical protein